MLMIAVVREFPAEARAQEMIALGRKSDDNGKGEESRVVNNGKGQWKETSKKKSRRISGVGRSGVEWSGVEWRGVRGVGRKRAEE